MGRGCCLPQVPLPTFISSKDELERDYRIYPHLFQHFRNFTFDTLWEIGSSEAVEANDIPLITTDPDETRQIWRKLVSASGRLTDLSTITLSWLHFEGRNAEVKLDHSVDAVLSAAFADTLGNPLYANITTLRTKECERVSLSG